MRELLPALWFPITAILGSLMTSSVPQSRSALTISLSFCLESAYSVPPREAIARTVKNSRLIEAGNGKGK